MRTKEKAVDKNKMLNKIISIILLFLIIFMQTISFPINIKAASDYEGLKLVVDPITSLNAGDTVTITISTDGAPIGSLDAYIIYDLSNFEQVIEDDITCIAQNWRVDMIDYDEEYYGINTGYLIISNSKGRTNTGDIAKITLKLKNTITSTTFAMSDTYVVLDDNSSVGPLDDIIVEIKPYIANQYNITYNANTTDTVTRMPPNGTKTEDIDYIIGAAPERTGYTFKGWNTQADGSGTSYVAGATYSTNADLTLYAQWEKIIIKSTLTVNPNGGVWEGSSATQKFTQDEQTTKQINNPTSTPNGNIVRFNSNGGTVSVLQATQTTSFSGWTGATLSGTTYTFGTSNETITANYVGDNITLPTATKKGTAFLGWYDSNGNYIGNAGDLYAPTYTTPNAVVALTARYEEETYTLTIDANGGTYIGSTTLQGAYNSTVTVNNPTKTGYTVTLDNNDGTGITTLTQTYTFDGWTCSAGTINGTTYTFGASNATLIANYTANTVTLPTPTRTGYTFKGWYTAATGGTKINSPYTPTSDTILYAQWTANIYTITFNPGQGGTVDQTSKVVTYDQPYGILPTPTKPGYVFKQWNDENGVKVSETDIVNVTKDITLIAEWENAKYTITFDPDGGEVNPTSKQVTNGDRYGTLPIPTKIGYTFEGWINANGDKIESTTRVNLTDDEILTAKWEADKYTITFDPGKDGSVEETSREAIYGEPYGTLPIPTRPGYTFIGWYDENRKLVDENDIIDRLENIVLTAEWEGNEYQLTFDYDGGTGNISNKTIKNGETYGELPEATREGHTFLGWYDDNGNKVESTNVVNITSDITLHAGYEINKYFVTFKNDDGTEIKTIKVVHGSNATFTGGDPVKNGVAAGYEAKFTGWIDEEDLQNVTEDVTVTATYEVKPIVYTITYYNLKDAENSENPTTYTIEDEDIELIDLLDQGKYIFAGWYTSNKEDAEKVTSIDTSKLGNIVLYAQWENDELYFSSEKYKVGENDIDNYEDGDIYLDKIEPETTVSELIDNCDTNGIITVINEDGEVLKEDDLVGTKMTIKVTRYDEEITLTSVVMGDLDGDGKVTATDLSALNQAILYKQDPEEVRFKAADLDDNEKLTATDLSTINNTILGTIELTYNKDQAIITSL